MAKNLQKKIFCIKLWYKCFRDFFKYNSGQLFILLLFIHMKMKKMLIGAFLGMFAVAGVAVLPNYASAQEESSWDKPKADTNFLNSKQKLTWSKFLDTIKNAINWILGLLASIALVFCLYGWFLMVTSAWDEKKYSSWLNVLKYAAIGIAIIWLSWMIISVIFWFVGTLSGWNQSWVWSTDNINSDKGNILNPKGDWGSDAPADAE